MKLRRYYELHYFQLFELHVYYINDFQFNSRVVGFLQKFSLPFSTAHAIREKKLSRNCEGDPSNQEKTLNVSLCEVNQHQAL